MGGTGGQGGGLVARGELWKRKRRERRGASVVISSEKWVGESDISESDGRLERKSMAGEEVWWSRWWM